MTTPIIIALDFPKGSQAWDLAERLDPRRYRLKIGKELFTAAGPDLIRGLALHDFEIFLDLKFHDIPNTVAGACQAAARLGVWMINVHASGGRAMMQAAREAVAHLPQRPLITAVTVLTSLSAEDLAETGIKRKPAEQVRHLATLAQECGMDGAVCSAREAADLRKTLGADFKLVTPGIRLPGSAPDDQHRTMTPAEALAAGADYLVVGRPVTAAADPLVALQNLENNIKSRKERK